MNPTQSVSIFLERINNIHETLTGATTAGLLTDIGMITSPHNIKARILRNGLAITSFLIVEDYFKYRTGEAIQSLKSRSIAFTTLHENLRAALTYEALDSISYRASNLKKNGEDYILFVQQETKRIASSLNSRFSMSKYSLGWNRSNLQWKDITGWLKLFRVQGGANTINLITANAEATVPFPEQTFNNAMSRRHSAAHDPEAASPIADLIDFTKQARAIVLAYDTLLTKSIYEFNRPNLNHINGVTKIDHTNISFRFIKENGTNWDEYFPNTLSPIVNSSNTLRTAIGKAKTNAAHNKEVILIKDNADILLNWIYTD